MGFTSVKTNISLVIGYILDMDIHKRIRPIGFNLMGKLLKILN